MSRTSRRRVVLVVLLGLLAWGAYAYHSFMAPPRTRLPPGASYPHVPPDEHLHYLLLPLDHDDPDAGSFVGFYRLNRSGPPDGGVVFVLTDGQQPLVAPEGEHEVLAEKLGAFTSITMGPRGVAPTLFPEVYAADGTLRPDRAVALYSSWQQVEDIERIRQDAARRGYLPADGRIMLLGGSGGGLLVQQYLSRYGEHVSRAIIEVSGAPDIARSHGLPAYSTFAARLRREAPEVLDHLGAVLADGRVDRTSLLFILQRLPYESIEGEAVQRALIDALWSGRTLPYYAYWLRPRFNYPFVSRMLSPPSMDGTRVRMFELLGEGLLAEPSQGADSLNLMYAWTREVLADFLKAARASTLAVPQLDVADARRRFTGEVLVISATKDHVYSLDEGRLLAQAYPNSVWAVFEDTHRMRRAPVFYRQFRAAFFQYGMGAPAFETYLHDPRQKYTGSYDRNEDPGAAAP